MTAHRRVTLVCNASTEHQAVYVPVSNDPFQTVASVRKAARRDGWHRTDRGMDVCPACWAAGRRP